MIKKNPKPKPRGNTVGEKTKMKSAWIPRRSKRCRFCVEKAKEINYKDVEILKKFISERGRILHRRFTGVCAKHQRMVTKVIKQARNVALLPYTVE